MPPPWADPGHLTFFIFFWSNSPPCGPFLCSNAPLPRDFLGVKCPAPWAEVTLKPILISEQGFQHCHFYYFLYTSSMFTFIIFFCVHSDHLGSRYELSAFGTLQSSVSRQEEVQEHKSVHSQFCNSRVFSEGSLPSGFNYRIGKEANLRKMYLALFEKILVFLTFLPGLFAAGPHSEEEFKKWSLELRVTV